MEGIKVLVLGYYDRQNIGDDTFKYVFQNYFATHWPKAQLTIKNTEDIEQIPEDINLVICGGGDIINDYFMNKIQKLTEPIIDKVPIYAVGVGFPYQSMIEKDCLDTFDFVIHRNHTLNELLLKKYTHNRIRYYPDLAFLLPSIPPPPPPDSPSPTDPASVFEQISNDPSPGKKIGVFLARPIYNPNDPDAYQNILTTLAKFLLRLAQEKKERSFLKIKSKCLNRNAPLTYQIYLLACNTHDSPKEDDRIINQDLHQLLKQPNVHLINTPLQIPNVIKTFKLFHLTICTRFHAHIYSILANTPFISIYSSQKVHNLLETHDLLDYGVKMDVNQETYHPVSLDHLKLSQIYAKIANKLHYTHYQQALNQINQHNLQEAHHLVNTLNNIIWSPFKFDGPTTRAFQYRVRQKTRLLAHQIMSYIYSTADTPTPDDMQETIEKLSQPCPPKDISVYHLTPETLRDQSTTLDFLVELVSFHLTGNRVTDFNYGLKQQILKPEYNLYESIKWIMAELHKLETKERLINNPIVLQNRNFNMKYFNQHDLEGFHRSGWSYVYKHLELFHNEQGIIMDSFLDKTFGWNYEFYKTLNIIPFTVPWIGFFHHTFNECYTQNNLIEIFKKPDFIASLQHCRGIFVLSQYLQEAVSRKLQNLDLGHIKVNVLIHPTELIDNCFTFSKFLKNPEKKVVQIGAWYRNSYAIYQLPPPKTLKKCALKGKDMHNYYLSNQQFQEVRDTIYDLGNTWSGNIEKVKHCRPHELLEQKCNKYLTGLVTMLEQNHESVEIISYLSNEEYDTLLSENVVFINLVDASAVNTIIECIVRQTPIIVNRLPAVEEYLGEDYPLYYSNLNEAQELLDNLEKLEEGHQYLKNMDTTRFHINNFLHDFIYSEIFQGIPQIEAETENDLEDAITEEETDPDAE